MTQRPDQPRAQEPAGPPEHPAGPDGTSPADEAPPIEAELDEPISGAAGAQDAPPPGVEPVPTADPAPFADPPAMAAPGPLAAAQPAVASDPEADLAALASAEYELGAPAPSRRAAPRRRKRSSLKAAAVPVLATVGLLLAGFAVYGLTLVMDPRHPQREPEEVLRMGWLMLLAGGGIAACLLAGAVFYFIQVQRETAT